MKQPLKSTKYFVLCRFDRVTGLWRATERRLDAGRVDKEYAEKYFGITDANRATSAVGIETVIIEYPD